MTSSAPTSVSRPLIAITGPTGVGKSRFALKVAERIGGEIVNFDSVQMVRGLDTGSAKPSTDDRERIPHHLIDIIEPGEELNAADFARLAEESVLAIDSRGHFSILVGGTGFYLRALLAGLPDMPERDAVFRQRFRAIWSHPRGPRKLRGWLERIDPAAASKIAPADRHRTERALEVWFLTRLPISARSAPTASTPERWPNLKIALSTPRHVLNTSIDRRVESMYEQGLVEETRELLARHPPSSRSFDAIGYREAARVIRDRLVLDEAIAETKRRTRAYAKRQLTWLRSQPDLVWIDVSGGIETAVAMVVERVESQPLAVTGPL